MAVILSQNADTYRHRYRRGRGERDAEGQRNSIQGGPEK